MEKGKLLIYNLQHILWSHRQEAYQNIDFLVRFGIDLSYDNNLQCNGFSPKQHTKLLTLACLAKGGKVVLQWQ